MARLRSKNVHFHVGRSAHGAQVGRKCPRPPQDTQNKGTKNGSPSQDLPRPPQDTPQTPQDPPKTTFKFNIAVYMIKHLCKLICVYTCHAHVLASAGAQYTYTYMHGSTRLFRYCFPSHCKQLEVLIAPARGIRAWTRGYAKAFGACAGTYMYMPTSVRSMYLRKQLSSLHTTAHITP